MRPKTGHKRNERADGGVNQTRWVGVMTASITRLTGTAEALCGGLRKVGALMVARPPLNISTTSNAKIGQPRTAGGLREVCEDGYMHSGLSSCPHSADGPNLGPVGLRR